MYTWSHITVAAMWKDKNVASDVCMRLELPLAISSAHQAVYECGVR